MNLKKLRRLYREERQTVRKRGGRKRALGTRRPLALPSRPNERWSMDFVSDAFTDGRRFRVMTIVADFTGVELAAIVHLDRLRIAGLPADAFQCLDDILASVGEACVGCRAVARVRIDHGQDAQLLAGRELVVNEVHLPDVVRPDSLLAILPELCLDQALGRLCADSEISAHASQSRRNRKRRVPMIGMVVPYDLRSLLNVAPDVA